MGPHNLIRVLSKLGYCSRKEALSLVKSGAVSVNGRVALSPGLEILEGSKITVNGQLIRKSRYRYIILNKPSGYVTTRSDELNRKTVYDLLTKIPEWLSPVGRLDKETEGLLIFTNDTSYANFLTDPVNGVPRTYRVLVNGEITPDIVQKILKGIDIGSGEHSRPIGCKILKNDKETTLLDLTLTEGKNREIRRLFDSLSRKVLSLTRISYGPYKLEDIPRGEWREVSRL